MDCSANMVQGLGFSAIPPAFTSSEAFFIERERELRKEGREVPSRVRLREGPIGSFFIHQLPESGYDAVRTQCFRMVIVQEGKNCRLSGSERSAENSCGADLAISGGL